MHAVPLYPAPAVFTPRARRQLPPCSTPKAPCHLPNVIVSAKGCTTARHLCCCAVQGPPQQNFASGPFYAPLQVSAPKLAIVGSGLSMTWNVASLSAPNLTALDNDFKGLAAFPPSLAVGGGDLQITCTLQLQTLTLPALQTASSIQVGQHGGWQVTGLWPLSQCQDSVWSGGSACCQAGDSSILEGKRFAALSVAVRPCCSWGNSSAGQSASRPCGPAACVAASPPSHVIRPPLHFPQAINNTALVSLSLPSIKQLAGQPAGQFRAIVISGDPQLQVPANLRAAAPITAPVASAGRRFI